MTKTKKDQVKFLVDLSRKYNNQRAAERVASSSPFRVVFLVHHLHAWPAVEGIWRAMTLDNNFQPIIITIPHKFNKSQFAGENYVSDYLTKKSIPHIRFPFTSLNEDLRLLLLKPDAVIRQSPWEDQYPKEYRTFRINYIRDIHTEYGLSIIEEKRYRLNPLLNFSWIVLCANEDQKEIYCQENPLLKRVFVTGYPKFEILENKIARSRGFWPFPGKTNSERRDRPYRILWTAHHSVDPSESYGFGVFPRIWKEMINWVKSHQDIEVVFRPHPQLIEQRPPSNFPQATKVLLNFLKEWRALPNTKLSVDDDYAHLFAASDCLISDGISFLAEYQITEKPIIYIDSQHHRRFNKLGEHCIRSSYVVYNMDQLKKTVPYLIDCFKNNKKDRLVDKRKETHNYLMPYRGHTMQRILQVIKKEMSDVLLEDFYKHLEHTLDRYF